MTLYTWIGIALASWFAAALVLGMALGSFLARPDYLSLSTQTDDLPGKLLVGHVPNAPEQAVAYRSELSL